MSEGTNMALSYTCNRFFSFMVILLFLAGLTSLIVWLVYRPSKPSFHMTGAAIYQLNATFPSQITTTMQVTVVSHNPTKRASAYYDRLSAYVSYHGQAITTPASLPPMFQESHGTVVISPIIGGEPVPVSQDVWNGLMTDEMYGVVGLRLVLLGRLRWKAGVFWSGHNGLYVKCDVLVGCKKGFLGQVPLLGSPECSVYV